MLATDLAIPSAGATTELVGVAAVAAFVAAVLAVATSSATCCVVAAAVSSTTVFFKLLMALEALAKALLALLKSDAALDAALESLATTAELYAVEAFKALAAASEAILA